MLFNATEYHIGSFGTSLGLGVFSARLRRVRGVIRCEFPMLLSPPAKGCRRRIELINMLDLDNEK